MFAARFPFSSRLHSRRPAGGVAGARGKRKGRELLLFFSKSFFFWKGRERRREREGTDCRHRCMLRVLAKSENVERAGTDSRHRRCMSRVLAESENLEREGPDSRHCMSRVLAKSENVEREGTQSCYRSLVGTGGNLVSFGARY